MSSGSDIDDIPAGRSARKRLLPKIPSSESEASDADETTPLKSSKSADKTPVRSSGRIHEKKNRRFKMPSREEVLAGIPTPSKKTPEKLSRITPKKLVNMFSRVNNRYNQDDLDPLSSGSDMEGFLASDNEVESSHSSQQSNSSGSEQSSSDSSSPNRQRRHRKSKCRQSRGGYTSSSSSSSCSGEQSDSSSSTQSCGCGPAKNRKLASSSGSRKKGNQHCDGSCSSSSSSSSSSLSSQQKPTRRKKKPLSSSIRRRLSPASRNQVEDSDSDSDTIPLDTEYRSSGGKVVPLDNPAQDKPESTKQVPECPREKETNPSAACNPVESVLEDTGRHDGYVVTKRSRRKFMCILSEEDSDDKNGMGELSCTVNSGDKVDKHNRKFPEKSCRLLNGHTSGSDSGIKGMSSPNRAQRIESDENDRDTVPLISMESAGYLTRRPSSRAEKMRQKREMSLLRLQMCGFKKQNAT